jgi:hypothetical protein
MGDVPDVDIDERTLATMREGHAKLVELNTWNPSAIVATAAA